MFKIGDFSRLAQVTVKALRHYDRLDLLRPEQIDPDSGYRFYTAAQLPRLYQILALKDLGFSLQQVGQLLDADLSPGQLREMLRQKGAEVRAAIGTEQRRLTLIEERLRQIEARVIEYPVTLKAVGAVQIASLRAILPAYTAVGALFGELLAYQRRHQLAAGEWISIWHDGEYRETDIQAEVAFATATPLPPHERISLAELPAVETMACVNYRGAMRGIGAAHEALVAWLAREGYRLAGPNRTVALDVTGPPSAEGVVELQYPVARESPGTEKV